MLLGLQHHQASGLRGPEVPCLGGFRRWGDSRSMQRPTLFPPSRTNVLAHNVRTRDLFQELSTPRLGTQAVPGRDSSVNRSCFAGERLVCASTLCCDRVPMKMSERKWEKANSLLPRPRQEGQDKVLLKADSSFLKTESKHRGIKRILLSRPASD